jgi:tetratricopeptide (TPR) repeat protein
MLFKNKLLSLLLKKKKIVLLNNSKLTSEEYYLQGNEYRKSGDWQQAINSYNEAIALNPSSLAVTAKRMLEDILSYYNKDMYNP